MTRDQIIEMIQNDYDPKPSTWHANETGWDDGAATIADKIMTEIDTLRADRDRLAERCRELEAAQNDRIAKAAASIATLVDEYTQRGWNAEGRADFARVIKRRLSRFWPVAALRRDG